MSFLAEERRKLAAVALGLGGQILARPRKDRHLDHAAPLI